MGGVNHLLGFGSFEKAKELFQSRSALLDGILKLQRSINLIELVIPVVAKVMDEKVEGVKILDTHIIQELLQRAKNEGKSDHKEVYSQLLTNLSGMYSEEEIAEMVDTIAWIRRHLKAATVTDENDAQSVSRSAQEMLASLKQILFKVSNYQVNLLFKPSFPAAFPELPEIVKETSDLETQISKLNKVTAHLQTYEVVQQAVAYTSFTSRKGSFQVDVGQKVQIVSTAGDGSRHKIIWSERNRMWPTKCWVDAKNLRRTRNRNTWG